MGGLFKQYNSGKWIVFTWSQALPLNFETGCLAGHGQVALKSTCPDQNVTCTDLSAPYCMILHHG